MNYHQNNIYLNIHYYIFRDAFNILNDVIINSESSIYIYLILNLLYKIFNLFFRDLL